MDPQPSTLYKSGGYPTDTMTISNPSPLKSEDRVFAATAPLAGPDIRRLWLALAAGGLGSMVLTGLDLTLTQAGAGLALLLGFRVLAVLAALGVARLALSRGVEAARGPLALWQGLLVAGQLFAFSQWSESLPGHLAAILLLMLVYLLAPNRAPVALGLGVLLTAGHLGIYWLCPAPEPFPDAGIALAAAALNLMGFLALAHDGNKGSATHPAEAVPPAPPAVPEPAPRPGGGNMPDLHVLAHDLRTPLNGMLGFAEVLSRTGLTPEQASHLEQIRISAERMRQLLDQRLTSRGGGAEAARGTPPTGTQGQGAARALSVLVVEDDDVSRNLARVLLEQEGHRVVEAMDGQAAVESAAAGGIDLVLMDIRLPVLGGTAAARRIRALPDPRAAAVPIFAVTGNADAADQARHAEAGMDGTLRKPLGREALRAVLAEVAAKKAGPAATAKLEPSPSRPLPPEPDPAVLDGSVLDGHRDILGPARVAHVVDSFLQTAPATVAAVEAALAAGDLKALGRAAHKLGSGALTVGLPALARLCRETEAKADGGAGDTALALGARIPGAYADGALALEGYKARLDG